ncbi:MULTISPECIES: NAD(P)H-dependent oxidoreductase subunit E [Sedimentibacter]|uniref:NAD(P)H-dependent oxidoreductase subunit E n=1 Tax=Sedimentibacter hydroxybenzoicus DSM 7310 TaxID=1123245 RepID=A0A974BH96_SEDHY|nr:MULTISPECIES: NAD(P)H-dependent oxidoreductase subunit E [Sedimentibacter]NYB72665.1 NAD(P)H-dependent oxidoreductase subunit E [Sedimentibacter hydroxybenzoicus DSM 7310]HCX61462.1 NAD(P)H-dependent oxidoreductase subunit E [Clostridiales bacterium]
MQNDFVQLKQKEFAELKEYIDSVKNVQGILMQTLQKAQDIFGYLPLEVQKFISDETNIPLADIYGVVTFYTQFTIEEKGKHTIGVCLGTACYVKGSQEIIDKIADELDVKVGQTTEDKLFTLEATRCLGCCGLAPVMVVDEDVYGKVDSKKVPEIIAKYRN